MESKTITGNMEEDNTKPYIKITKNSKGFNWEIKVMGNDFDEAVKLADKMIERYGRQESG